jgi:hypothetical protein
MYVFAPIIKKLKIKSSANISSLFIYFLSYAVFLFLNDDDIFILLYFIEYYENPEVNNKGTRRRSHQQSGGHVVKCKLASSSVLELRKRRKDLERATLFVKSVNQHQNIVLNFALKT